MGAGRGGNRRRGWYCWVCDRCRANVKFSAKGRRRHVCSDCAKLPRETRDLIRAEKDISGFLEQRNISERNIARLRELTNCTDELTRLRAAAVLEVALLHPRRRKRISFLLRNHRELAVRLRELSLMWVDLYEDYEDSFLLPEEPDDDIGFDPLVETCRNDPPGESSTPGEEELYAVHGDRGVDESPPPHEEWDPLPF